jgi:hypothetical protein
MEGISVDEVLAVVEGLLNEPPSRQGRQERERGGFESET